MKKEQLLLLTERSMEAQAQLVMAKRCTGLPQNLVYQSNAITDIYLNSVVEVSG